MRICVSSDLCGLIVFSLTRSTISIWSLFCTVLLCRVRCSSGSHDMYGLFFVCAHLLLSLSRCFASLFSVYGICLCVRGHATDSRSHMLDIVACARVFVRGAVLVQVLFHVIWSFALNFPSHHKNLRLCVLLTGPRITVRTAQLRIHSFPLHTHTHTVGRTAFRLCKAAQN